MRRTAVLALAALLALTGLAACGDDGDDVGTGDDPSATEPGATEPAPAADDPLADRDFHVATVTGHELVDGTSITLAFADGQVNVEAGCNHLFGSYSLDGTTLVVDDLGGTEMGCDQPLMDQDAWISAFLADRPTVELTGGEATALTAGATTLTLTRPTPEPPAELVGPTWTLDTILAGTGPEGTAASVPTGVTATITFEADGTYGVSAGCNSGSGTWAEAGAGIYQIDPPALTRRRCADEAMDVEGAVVAVLDGEVSASLEADRLTLESDDAGLSFLAG
jgi:heat shock protein HslJ